MALTTFTMSMPETLWNIALEEIQQNAGMVESAVAWLGDEEVNNVPGVVDFNTINERLYFIFMNILQ